MARLRRIVTLILGAYLLFVLAVALFQRRLLFFPTRQAEPEIVAMASGIGLEAWRDESGAIIGWKRAGASSKLGANKLLVFHGNAGNAVFREDYLKSFEALEDGGKWEVWLAEYPGYGARSGRPSRDSFREEGRQAVAKLQTLDARPLFLMGESLGSGVAAELAGDPANRIAGVILVTPFARLAEVAQQNFPILPARLILRDRWDNQRALAGFHGPVAVLIAEADEVVGARQGEQLFAALAEPKRCWRFPDAHHNDPDIHGAEWAPQVSVFLLQNVTGNP